MPRSGRLRPDCWGRGLATEAGRAFLRLGFEELGLQRIVAIAHPDNRASHAVMERLQMPFEGCRLGRELGLLDPELEVLLYALEREARAAAAAPRARR